MLEQNPHTYTRSDIGEVGFFLEEKSSLTRLSVEAALRFCSYCEVSQADGAEGGVFVQSQGVCLPASSSQRECYQRGRSKQHHLGFRLFGVRSSLSIDARKCEDAPNDSERADPANHL
jgi:hypothetical protein